jgi:hypothetical protein
LLQNLPVSLQSCWPHQAEIWDASGGGIFRKMKTQVSVEVSVSVLTSLVVDLRLMWPVPTRDLLGGWCKGLWRVTG